MSERRKDLEASNLYRLTFRVRPPSGCPVIQATGTVSDLFVCQHEADCRCEILVTDSEGSPEVRQFRPPTEMCCPCSELTTHGRLPRYATAQSGDELELSIVVTDIADAQSLGKALDRLADGAKLIEYEHLENSDSAWTTTVDLGRLTKKRRVALRQALETGYYETPSRTSLETMAAQVGISSSAFGTRLRKAEQVVFDQIRESL